MVRMRWLLLFCLAWPACHGTNPSPARPKLIVLVVFDQLRADYLTRWPDHFGDGGFRRLTNGGAYYTNCHYPYANTFTGPGHATMATGYTPDEHGIIDNEWHDQITGKMINCSTNDRSCGSPERLLKPTFADALKTAANGCSKVVALSHKDRGACLLGGKHPDACYWFDTKSGTFVTSSYYRDGVHPWVASFNANKHADEMLTRTWSRFRPELDYTLFAGPDDVLAERPGIHRKQGRVFPHAFSRQVTEKDEAKFDELVCSPFANELLLQLAITATRALELGRDEHVDFLSVSFSANDIVGHCFGPDSQEAFDMTLHSDDILARLLNTLDHEVGKDNYLIALCSDHGVCPLPEVAQAKNINARRLDPSVIRSQAEAFLSQRFESDEGQATWIEAFEFPWIYLNQRTIRSRNLKEGEVASELALFLRRQDWAAGAYVRTELRKAQRDEPLLGAKLPIGMMWRSFHPERSGDIGLVLKPYHLCMSKSEGTTHGSPYEYDTHVPLIFYGNGAKPGQLSGAVSPQLIGGIFAQAAGIPMTLPPAAVPPQRR
jgi:predicted AlkP superfamily pyrophosphatase or phosphodiesterase